MGKLTTHVLDTSKGRPAAGVQIDLYREGARVASVRTNHDGRTDEPLLAELSTGTYEIVFHAGEYLGDNAFFNLISVRFTISGAASDCHIPLLLSPFGYSTYRGS